MDENPTSLIPERSGSRFSNFTNRTVFRHLGHNPRRYGRSIADRIIPGAADSPSCSIDNHFVAVWDSPDVMAYTVLDWLPVLVIAVGYN